MVSYFYDLTFFQLQIEMYLNTSMSNFFIDLIVQLEETDHVKRLDSETIKRLSNMDLKCNQCSFVAKNMPNLKEHLLKHYNAI